MKILTSYGVPIIIDFGADSCIPCKEMAPVLKKINSEMQGKAIIKFVDVWKNGDAARDFPIQVIPTQVFINSDGTPYVPSDDIGIEFTMYSYKETEEHVGGTGQRDTKRAFWLSVVFATGTAVTFTVLGVIASLAGRLMGTSASWWYIILGIRVFDT